MACLTASPFDLRSADAPRHQAASGNEVRLDGNLHDF